MDNQVNKAIDLLISEEEELFSNPVVFGDAWLDKNVIGTWKRLDNGKINVSGHLRISGIKNLGELPYEFHEVSGDFYIEGNQLDSLKGSPEYVGGNFSCNNNYLKSLEGSPQMVGGSFDCSRNLLNTLEGGPEWVGANYNAETNPLKSLKGVARAVGGTFDGSPDYFQDDYFDYIWDLDAQERDE